MINLLKRVLSIPRSLLYSRLRRMRAEKGSPFYMDKNGRMGLAELAWGCAASSAPFTASPEFSIRLRVRRMIFAREPFGGG